MELRLDQGAGMSMGIFELPSADASPCLRVQARQRVLGEPRSQWLGNAVAGQPLTMTFVTYRKLVRDSRAVSPAWPYSSAAMESTIFDSHCICLTIFPTSSLRSFLPE